MLVQLRPSFHLVPIGLYSLGVVVVWNMVMMNCQVGALPARLSGHKVCRGLPADLQPASGDGSQRQMQRLKLGSYIPGQHVIVSILEDSLKKEDMGNLQTRTYALQAISDVTGHTIGRFKSVRPATELHRCGDWTILLDGELHERNGVVFGWLPPHEGAAQPVTIFVTNV